MNIYDVIVRPLYTEKSEMQKWDGKYTFEVHLRATKTDVKRAVEEIWGVDVEKVNTLVMPAKISKMRGRRSTVRHSTWKKAVVTLVPGQRIEALEV